MTAGTIRTTRSRRLERGAARQAQRRLDRQLARNPLRRAMLTCHGWVRDPSATVGDWLWCAHADCGQWRRVVDVAE